MTMIDYHGYLLDPTEIVCITPMREDSTGWQFFAMHFRGGSTETFTVGDAGDRGRFVSLVGNARLGHGMHRMIDFNSYLIDLSEVTCVTPVREDSTGWRFFVVHFRGGGTESFTGEQNKQGKFIELVKNAELDQLMRQNAK